MALAVLVLGIAITSCGGSSPARSLVLTVERGTVGPAIPNGFVGLSIEFTGLEPYAGQDPDALNPTFVQLIRNLAPGQRPVLRIGGDSTDWTWWPVAGMARSPGIRYQLTERWLRIARALSQALDARLILGINLEADSPRLAAGEAQALLGGIGRQGIDALEIGNEPELYAGFGWYVTPTGVHVPGRPRGYDFADYLHDFSSFASALPSVPLAGPSSGGPQWIRPLASFLAAEPHVRLVTLHAYPLKHCRASSHVTLGQLLSDASSAGLANGIAPYVRIAQRRGVRLRIDEMNAVSCGGERGVSETFGSALWALDTLFALARVGVAGVNVDTGRLALNSLFDSSQARGRWQSAVHPEYYGMMMFAQAAPAGSRLLALSWSARAGLEAWATRAPDGRIRVVLINRLPGPQTVDVRVPSRSATATLERLQAPSLGAQSQTTLGGQSFGAQTATGLLAGRPQLPTIAPVSGSYKVSVPGYSAAMLTLHG
jgi:hypothetical protein